MKKQLKSKRVFAGLLQTIISIQLTLVFCVNTSSAAQSESEPESPALMWPLENGEEVSGSYFVTADSVIVLDWQNQVQYAIKRRTLPKHLVEVANAVDADLKKMVKPFDTTGKKLGEDFVVGTYNGKPPYDIQEMSTCTMIVDEMQRVQYSKNGRICKVEHADMNNKKDGVQLKLYPSGEICQIYFFSSGTMTGPYLQFYPDGTILHASIKRDGKSDGSEINFHPNGNIASIYPVQAGVFQGETEHFDLHGNLYGTQNFRNNRPGAMNIVRELKSQDELDKVTRASEQRTAVVRFAELWKP